MPREAQHRRSTRPGIPLAPLALALSLLGAGSPDPALGAPAGPAMFPAHATHALAIPGLPRFINYSSPAGVGDDSGEPSIGSNWSAEQSFSNSNGAIPNGGSTNYFGGFSPYMLNVIFNDCQSPAITTWNQKPLLTASTPRVFGDPILYTDPVTGRTLVSQEEGLTPAGSTTDITDNDGDTFSPSQGSGAPSCVDHQTLGGGPFHAPLTSPLYPRAVYYCSQCVGDAVCSLSLDGGLTFLPSVPIFTVNECAGLHGHIKVGADGTAYVPDKSCGGSLPFHDGGQPSVVVSEDNGATWAVRKVPGGTSMVDDDASVGVSRDGGTIYLGWQSADGHPRIARSDDKGLTWGPIRDVGASVGVVNCAFPAVVAGDADRAAFAFYGTTTPGAYDAPEFPGVWYLYIATTFDGGLTWTTQNVTPGDPIQRGGICGDGDCRNMLDFFDATIDKRGRVLVGWDDGCINGCVNGPPNSFSAKAVITRQSGGKRMFAEFDPVEPRIPEAPGLSGSLVNTTVSLEWQAPDNGGATITSYNVYRSVDGGAFALLANVTGTGLTDTVDPTRTNTYRLTAVNAEGEGPHCTDYTPAGVAATACILPGLIAVNDVLPDGSNNDSGQNTPPDPSVNVRDLLVAEPYVGQGVNQLTFTLHVGQGGTVAPSSQWYVVWNRRSIAADGSDRRFVAMKSDLTGALSFVYGDFGPPLPLDGSPPALNANTPTPLGPADSGSYDPVTGVITIRLAASKADGTPLVAGNDLAGLNVRTYLARPDGGQRAQNNASDITGDGSYTLVGNASCFCTVDEPPVARLEATPASGGVPLSVDFDASGSSDNDAGDAVASYTFNFGDGSDPVTQSSPFISHTYQTASGPSGFFATLSVADQKCGTSSLNVAAVHVHATATADVTPLRVPRTFRITPTKNPSQGSTFFALDLDQSSAVTIQMFAADGRRVADLIDAWMPAGKHSLHWRGLDRNGNRIAPGVYMVRAKAGQRVTTTRVVIVP